MERKIDVIIVKRLTKDTLTCELKTIEDKLDTYYDTISCRCIDIVQRFFGGVEFDIVLDDEGLLKAEETGELPTSWWQDTKNEGYTPGYEGLFGVLVLCHHDDLGNLTSADEGDLLAVQSSYNLIPTKTGEEIALLFHSIK